MPTVLRAYRGQSRPVPAFMYASTALSTHTCRLRWHHRHDPLSEVQYNRGRRRVGAPRDDQPAVPAKRTAVGDPAPQSNRKFCYWCSSASYLASLSELVDQPREHLWSRLGPGRHVQHVQRGDRIHLTHRAHPVPVDTLAPLRPGRQATPFNGQAQRSAGRCAAQHRPCDRRR